MKIETAWKNFEKLVIPASAPEIQRVEMRKAFFAGSVALYDMLIGAADAEGAAGVDTLFQISEELSAFGKVLAAELASSRVAPRVS